MTTPAARKPRVVKVAEEVAALTVRAAAPPLSVKCVLEESPKWAALQELMGEITFLEAAKMFHEMVQNAACPV